MSRVIKFRAWNPRISKMSQNTVTIETLAEAGCKVHVDGLIWMQFTGLTDCNGVEIYEGDIVRAHMFYPPFGDDKRIVGEVVFESECFVIGWKNSSGDDGWCHFYETSHDEEPCIEVIGNIYEHPHLIDRSSEQA